MPKLPEWQDAPNPRIYGPTPVKQISMGIATGQAAAARRMGNAIAQTGNDIAGYLKKQEDEEEKLNLLELDVEWQERTGDAYKAFNDDNDYKTYVPRWDAKADEITKDIGSRIKDPAKRKEFMLRKRYRANQMGEGLYARSEKMRDEENAGRINRSLESAVNIATDTSRTPQERADAMADIRGRLKYVEETGMVTPGKAAELRDNYDKNVKKRLLQNRVDVQPAEVLEELKTYEKDLLKDKEKREARETGGLDIIAYTNVPRHIGKKRTRPVRGVIAHYTEGSTNMDGLAEWANKTNTGANYYIDREGNVIEFAGDDIVMPHAGEGRRVPGDRAPHLGNVNTIGIEIMTPKGGKATPQQIEAFRKLTSRLAKTHGFSEKDIYGHGEVAPTHRKSTEAMDAVEAVRKQGFLQDEPPEPDEADPNMPPQEVIRREEIASNYDALKPEERYKLRVQAERALKQQTANAAVDLRNRIKSDSENIRRDGVPSEELDLSALPKDKRQVQEARRARDFVYYEATRDAADLSEDDLEVRRRELRDKIIRPGQADRADNERLLKDIEKRHDQIVKEREKDPATAVDATPEVEAVRNQYDPEVLEGQGPAGLAAREDLIEARLAKQEELGVSDTKRRALTRSENERLIPDISELDHKQVKQVLTDAVRTAIMTYGTKAPEALESAMRHRKIFERGKMPRSVLERALKDTELEPSEISRLVREHDIAMQDTFMLDVTEGQDNPDRMPPPDSGWGPKPVPTVAQVEWARSHGAEGSAVFDQHFGEGAFDEAMAELAKKKAPTS